MAYDVPRVATTRDAVTKAPKSNKIGVALSVGGKLQSIYKPAPADAERSTSYKEVKVSEPLLVRYLRFEIIIRGISDDADKILITSFVKTEETKNAAAEVITCFDPEPTSHQRFSVTTFGAARFGHELLYYTPAYIGETLRLATSVWELNSANPELYKAIRSAVSGAASLPIFADLLPLSVSISQVVSIWEKLVNFFNKDDRLFKHDAIALYNNMENSPILQAGRYVVALGIDTPELIGGKYGLNEKSALLLDGQPVDKSSYIVFQVLNRQHDPYKDFNYALSAADLLRKTNRPGQGAEQAAKDLILDAMKAYNDRKAIEAIQSLAPTAKTNPADKEKILAYQKNLSKETAELLADWIKGIVGT